MKSMETIFWSATSGMLFFAGSMSAYAAEGTDLRKSAENAGTLFKNFGTAMVYGAMAVGIVLVITGLTKLSKNSPQDGMMDKLWPLLAGAALLAIGGIVGIYAGTFGFGGDKSTATGLFK